MANIVDKTMPDPDYIDNSWENAKRTIPATTPSTDLDISGDRKQSTNLRKPDDNLLDKVNDKIANSSPDNQSLNFKIEFGDTRREIAGPHSWDDEEDQDAELRLIKMRGAVRTLLECVGVDPDREGLVDTPARFSKAILFLTRGYRMDIDTVVNGALFRERYNDMIVMKDIEFHSLCEHHLVPFRGKVHIAYIPSGLVIGLSKLSRIVDMYSQRLQIQERLTMEVAEAVMKILNPLGVAVVVEAVHMCMEMRGVKKSGTNTITICALGCLENDRRTRADFLNLIGHRNP